MNLPNAHALIESLRSVGYTFEAAIADILDNSIAAKAKNIDIYYDFDYEPIVTIVDDGIGMSYEKLEEAMRFGSVNPLLERDRSDLGRFGLGLKSASLSQCRNLTVLTKQGDELNCLSWDLDQVAETSNWTIIEYSYDEYCNFEYFDKLMEVYSGTIVYLKSFDRVVQRTDDLRKSLDKKMAETRSHIELVFHRYIADGLRICINYNPLDKMDPFLENHFATQELRTQTIHLDGDKILVTPFSLPHMSKITEEDAKRAGGRNSLKSNQGFYIYRNNRLIIYGNWFRLQSKYEISKYARVRVDIPNTLDQMWDIDIKKSSATLPDSIKDKLKTAVLESVGKSGNIINYRGRSKHIHENTLYLWERLEDRESISYKINREFPEVELLLQELDGENRSNFNKILRLIEERIPTTSIYADMAKGVELTDNNDEEESLDEARYYLNRYRNKGMSMIDALNKVRKMEQIDLDEDCIEILKEEFGIDE